MNDPVAGMRETAAAHRLRAAHACVERALQLRVRRVVHAAARLLTSERDDVVDTIEFFEHRCHRLGVSSVERNGPDRSADRVASDFEPSRITGHDGHVGTGGERSGRSREAEARARSDDDDDLTVQALEHVPNSRVC